MLPASVAETETSMLETVIQYGTGKAAAIGQFAAGKTGTTSNYGDAWFVGWDSKFTVAVWVGYPNKLIPMTTDFNGTPVLGGTFPALIWHDFMVSALGIEKERAENSAVKKGATGAAGEASSATTPEGGGSHLGSALAPARPRAPPLQATRRAALPRRAAAHQRNAGGPNTPRRRRRPPAAAADPGGDAGARVRPAAPSTPCTDRRRRRPLRLTGAGARRAGCPPRRSASAARPRG